MSTTTSTPSSAASSTAPAAIQERKLQWGILSTAAILGKAVLPGMLKSDQYTVAAVASRDAAKARAFADQWGIAKAYGGYEALLADPEIDAIYNPLPNHLHVPWTLAAAKAGKHVLCEKPFALTATELEPLLPYATQVHIAEAVMVRHHPQWHKVRQLLQEGVIGDLRMMQGYFSYVNNNADNIRNQPHMGGGGLLDIGIYPIAAARFFFGAEPKQVTALIDRHPQFGVDQAASGILDFGHGRHMSFSVSTQAMRYQSLSLVGTTGQLDLDLPFNPLPDVPAHISVSNGNQHRADRQHLTAPACDQYQLQAENFMHQIHSKKPNDSGLLEAITQARVVDALFESAKSGRSIAL